MEISVDSVLQAVGFTLGLIYLWWEYHANSKMWLIGILMPMVSMWLYYRKGVYADFAMNIYYLVMAIYGYVAWTFGFSRKKRTPLPIRHATLRTILGGVGVLACVWGVLIFWLSRFTDSTVPVPDAFTTAASIVGTWFLARKYVEQWICWIAVDVVCVFLYIYKGIPLYGLLYGIYTIIAVFGYRKWLRLIQLEK